MTTLLHASNSASFLGIVPSLVGFTPRRSIVILPFRGSRTHGALRMDLPSDEIDPEDYASAAIGLVTGVDAVDAVAVVVYDDVDPARTRDGLVLPHAVQVDELLGCAQDAGLRVVDACSVTPGGWSSYLVDEPRLAPVPGPPPLPEGIGDVSGDQHAGVELPRPDLAESERVGRALLDLEDLFERGAHARITGDENPQAIAAITLLDDVPAFFEAILEPRDPQPAFATAALLWCLDRPVFRDVALTQWATDIVGGVRTLDAQLVFADTGRTIPDDLGDVFLGRGATPDVARLGRALEVVRHAAARAPLMLRRGPLTAAAWLSWALGRSTHAGHYLDQVREIDPRYGLAELLGTMLDAAHLPEWAFRRGAGNLT